jgi:hypothetical protein
MLDGVVDYPPRLSMVERISEVVRESWEAEDEAERAANIRLARIAGMATRKANALDAAAARLEFEANRPMRRRRCDRKGCNNHYMPSERTDKYCARCLPAMTGVFGTPISSGGGQV